MLEPSLCTALAHYVLSYVSEVDPFPLLPRSTSLVGSQLVLCSSIFIFFQSMKSQIFLSFFMWHFLNPHSDLQYLQLTDHFWAHSWTKSVLQVTSAAHWSSRIIPYFFHKLQICIVTPEWHLRYFLFYPSTERHCWFMFSFRPITTPVFCPAEVLLNQLSSFPCLCGWLFMRTCVCPNRLTKSAFFSPFFQTASPICQDNLNSQPGLQHTDSSTSS